VARGIMAKAAFPRLRLIPKAPGGAHAIGTRVKKI
jgi:hypothetical protein